MHIVKQSGAGEPERGPQPTTLGTRVAGGTGSGTYPAASECRGVSTTLIGHAIAAYRQAGFTRARLHVNSGNAGAVRLHAALGFTDSGRGHAMLQAPLR